MLSAPWHAVSPPEHHGASLGPGRGAMLWVFKVTIPYGEGFRARRIIEAHANPPTGLRKK